MSCSPTDATEFFLGDLVDLGTQDQRFSGILMPEAELNIEKVGITAQFLEDAAFYEATYANREYFLDKYKRVFSQHPELTGKQLTVVDIGCGSGVNSTIPILELYPKSRVISTDLSPNLLAMLTKYLQEHGMNDSVTCVCTDAMRSPFKSEVFDVAIGSSILHHLMDPSVALEAAARALKPGGIAIFFEPFEGFSVLRVAFERIVEDARSDTLPEGILSLLRALVLDFKTRSGNDRSAPHFKYMDDKWLFTRTYFSRVCAVTGYSSVSVLPLHDPVQLIRRLSAVLLRMGGGYSEGDLPAWAWAHIDHFDQTLSDDFKSDLVMEGAVVFRK